MKTANPFVTSGYRGVKYFCDRQKEVAGIQDAVENDRNITLFSHRRMGKSVLLKHVLAKLGRKGYLCVYADLYSTNSIKHFIQKLAEAIGASNIRRKESIIFKIVKSLGASLTLDPITGMPELDLSYVRNEHMHNNLKDIFSLLAAQKQKVVLVLDEFQEIVYYKDELNAEAELRSITQNYPQIRFIFSGSQRHLMIDIFGGSRRPFFQSTQMMDLQEIPNDKYLKFISGKFQEGGVEIEEGIGEMALEGTLLHTYYTQYLLNRLYGMAQEKITQDDYGSVFQSILAEQETLANTYRKLLTMQQWKLFVAVASETFVKEPYSQYFLRKYDLPAASSVARSLDAMKEDDLIIDCGAKGIRVFDVFLMRYLQRQTIGT